MFMKSKIVKTRLKHFVRALIALSVITACVMVAKVSAFVLETKAIPERIEKAIEVDSKKDDYLKQFQEQYAETAKKLKEKSLFSPLPLVKKNPITRVEGIIGNSVLIGEKLYKKGDKIGDAKIVLIEPKSITVRWDGKETKITPFDHFVPPPSAKKTKTQPTQPTPEKTVVQEQPRPQRPQIGQPRPRQMSPEERRMMMERFKAARQGGQAGHGRGQTGQGKKR